MTRSPLTAPDAVRRIRRDPRFREAVHNRIPDPDWRSRGRCLGLDPETFFPNAAEDPTAAVAICGECAVLGPCLAAALDSQDCDGVWGATTPEDRRPMREAWLSSPRARH